MKEKFRDGEQNARSKRGIPLLTEQCTEARCSRRRRRPPTRILRGRHARHTRLGCCWDRIPHRRRVLHG